MNKQLPLKRKSNRGDVGLDFIVSIFTLVIALVIYLAFAPLSCSSRWNESGFVTKWGPIAGCRISKDGERFIPEDRYREIADE